jgi:1,4-alpha-glucan branching enzyme
MADFAVDGIRMDSVNNVANWDFVQEFKELARHSWQKAGGTADKFLVVGEELSMPQALITQNRLTGFGTKILSEWCATPFSATTTRRNRASNGLCAR